MVLILSNDGDLSCDLVQDWLDFYHYPYLLTVSANRYHYSA